MRPAQSMYASREDWQKDLIEWMNADPSSENGKLFMVFDSETTVENFMFDGDMDQFGDCFFSGRWDAVKQWADENGYVLVTEEDPAYDELGVLLEDAAMQEEETFYDADGNESSSGIYDAGGHVNAERMAEWADDYRDRMRDRDVP